jgi:L-threonylcarbamoyladenylate synthase
MNTIIKKVNYDNPEESILEEASNFIKNNEVVAFPTETVYGLGANALDENSVLKIFEAKARPSDNPLIVHISKIKQLNDLVCEIPPIAHKLMDKFWPGALTIIFKKKELVPDITTAGRDSVAIRMPSHNIALKFIEKCNVPIAAPSANSFSKPSPTIAKHVYEDLNGKIPFIIDGGNCNIGLESTIIDLTQEKPMILRPGGITIEEIENVIGKVELHKSVLNPKEKVDIAKAPGMKYKHYSPNATVILIENSTIDKIIKRNKNKKIGIISLNKNLQINNAKIEKMELLNSINNLSHDIFKLFREMDDHNIELIIVDKIPSKDLGISILNRVKKAATHIE